MVYQPATVPVSEVCPNEFSRSKLLTSVNVTDCAVAGVKGWVERSEKLNRITRVDCAPKLFGDASAWTLKPEGEEVEPSDSSSTPRVTFPSARTRAPWSRFRGGFFWKRT